MHNPYYIKTITDAGSMYDIKVELLSDNWAIQLDKDGCKKYIVGFLFPLNDASSFKISNNKNLCSEILTRNNIPNVPHQIVISPFKLMERRSDIGNLELLRNFILKNGFPFLVKRNNSSKGVGVFLVKNEPELENVLAKIYLSDEAFCLSPFRKSIREYRNIVLDGKCYLSYEKIIPFIIGNGKSTVIELLAEFINNTKGRSLRQKPLFDESIAAKFSDVPLINEKVHLQWQHNRFLGTKYEQVINPELENISVRAANAIGARFVSVDVIESQKYGLEVLEINASVFTHSPIFSPLDDKNYDKTGEIFQLALKKVFELE
jgi:glutathione synthase/RimK-type ligase-like ATP-grasp enzyme